MAGIVFLSVITVEIWDILRRTVAAFWVYVCCVGHLIITLPLALTADKGTPAFQRAEGLMKDQTIIVVISAVFISRMIILMEVKQIGGRHIRMILGHSLREIILGHNLSRRKTQEPWNDG
jgi:hypothetical protein